jgi:hypothetical protein
MAKAYCQGWRVYRVAAELGKHLQHADSMGRQTLDPAAPPLSNLLQKAAQITLPPSVNRAAAERALAYDGAALRVVEEQREKMRQQTLAANRAKFVDGPVLEKFGTVYPTMRISSDWGVLEVQNGALLKPDWSAVSVVAPITSGSTLKGDGWTLELKPKWSIVPAGRRGDFTLQGPPH